MKEISAGFGNWDVLPWSLDLDNFIALKGWPKMLMSDDLLILLIGDGVLLLEILRQWRTI